MSETETGLKIVPDKEHGSTFSFQRTFDCGCLIILRDSLGFYGRYVHSYNPCEKHCEECVKNKAAPLEFQDLLSPHKFHEIRGR